MKTAKDYLEAANADVPRITGEQALVHYGKPENVFIDVRDSGAIAESGTIAGALRVPRGFLEFAADADSPYHNEAFDKSKNFYLVCGAGGQAALAGKTMKEMGFEHVTNIGGFGEWKEAGGATES
jgi:rhodanese-related sulfurtransferase